MAKKESFESKLAKIDENMKKLEQNETSLDESIEIYEKTQKLLKEV